MQHWSLWPGVISELSKVLPSLGHDPCSTGSFQLEVSLIMTLKIFLDDKSFHCLKQSIPPGSRSKSIIEKAVHLDLFGSNAVLSCEEAEARNLLLFAGHCPGVIASIHNAFRAAGLTFTTPDISGEGLASPLRRQRLSQHPLMSHRGHPTWPPLATTVDLAIRHVQ